MFCSKAKVMVEWVTEEARKLWNRRFVLRGPKTIQQYLQISKNIDNSEKRLHTL